MHPYLFVTWIHDKQSYDCPLLWKETSLHFWTCIGIVYKKSSTPRISVRTNAMRNSQLKYQQSLCHGPCRKLLELLPLALTLHPAFTINHGAHHDISEAMRLEAGSLGLHSCVPLAPLCSVPIWPALGPVQEVKSGSDPSKGGVGSEKQHRKHVGIYLKDNPEVGKYLLNIFYHLKECHRG